MAAVEPNGVRGSSGCGTLVKRALQCGHEEWLPVKVAPQREHCPCWTNSTCGVRICGRGTCGGPCGWGNCGCGNCGWGGDGMFGRGKFGCACTNIGAHDATTAANKIHRPSDRMASSRTFTYS